MDVGEELVDLKLVTSVELFWFRLSSLGKRAAPINCDLLITCSSYPRAASFEWPVRHLAITLFEQRVDADQSSLN